MIHQFSYELQHSSPHHDGSPLRTVVLEDLNNDGQSEVLLYKNEMEEAAIGLFNVELYGAFVWVDVYQKQGSEFKIANPYFQSFYRGRKTLYLHWLDRIEHPERLSADSQLLIKHNKQGFTNQLNQYISLIEGYKK
ncbi:hypothetical protein L2755_02645 [Shewanella abyssi]|uniref:hypothetical protein n=1 Tax=Shewanella abyssi TaxID=311789 RepID=UPI00200FABA9|nr:hypothetical protein [Shewanella abyssi]MCL1048533.1 hypothetical protein [Shewanella abyssi]